jgi:1,4-dihydroxy-2-naphthoate octaprenyltransferase
MAGRTLPAPTSAWGAWYLAVRPATLSAAVSPVLVGTAAAAARDHFRPAVFIAALCASILIQIGSNLANDVFDFEKGADTESRLGPPRVTATGVMTPQQVRNGMLLAFGGAAAIGVYLSFVGGWPILAIGAICILFAVLYTGGPYPLGYYGLGDAAVFVCFGMLAVLGSYYLQADSLNAVAWGAVIPVGFIVTAILVVNNLRDIDTDREAHKHTLGVLLGDHLTRVEYAVLIIGAYLSMPLLMAAGSGPWVWLSWLSLPLALPDLRAVIGGTKGRALNPVLKHTSRLHLAFGGLLALGLLLGG